jgi:hypothetical protein
MAKMIRNAEVRAGVQLAPAAAVPAVHRPEPAKEPAP